MEAIEDSGKSLKSVADAAEVSYEQLKKLKQNKSKSTNVEDAMAIANVFGKTLEEFMGGEEVSEGAEIALLLSKLSDQDRRTVLNFAKAQTENERPDAPKPHEAGQ